MIERKYNGVVSCVSLPVQISNTLDSRNIYTAQAIVDTGATEICISEDIAERLSIESTGVISMKTANGIPKAAKCLIDIKIDGEEFRHLNAVILPNISTEMLLGMNLLKLGDMSIKTSSGITEFQFEKNGQIM